MKEGSISQEKKKEDKENENGKKPAKVVKKKFFVK